jgi:hypothetical protein
MRVRWGGTKTKGAARVCDFEFDRVWVRTCANEMKVALSSVIVGTLLLGSSSPATANSLRKGPVAVANDVGGDLEVVSSYGSPTDILMSNQNLVSKKHVPSTGAVAGKCSTFHCVNDVIAFFRNSKDFSKSQCKPNPGHLQHYSDVSSGNGKSVCRELYLLPMCVGETGKNKAAIHPSGVQCVRNVEAGLVDAMLGCNCRLYGKANNNRAWGQPDSEKEVMLPFRLSPMGNLDYLPVKKATDLSAGPRHARPNAKAGATDVGTGNPAPPTGGTGATGATGASNQVVKKEHWTKKVYDDLIKYFDTNKDGRLGFEEAKSSGFPGSKEEFMAVVGPKGSASYPEFKNYMRKMFVAQFEEALKMFDTDKDRRLTAEEAHVPASETKDFLDHAGADKKMNAEEFLKYTDFLMERSMAADQKTGTGAVSAAVGILKKMFFF